MAVIEQIRELRRNGMTDAALATCRQWTVQNPADPIAWTELGLLMLASGQQAGAEQALRMAVKLGPETAAAWDGLGVLLRDQGKARDSEVCARKAISLEGSNAAFWLNLGSTLYLQMQWEDAAAAFRQCVALDAANPRAWCNLGAAVQVLNRLDEAKLAYEQSLALEPENLIAGASYSQIALMQGDSQAVRRFLSGIPAGTILGAGQWIAVGNLCKDLGDLKNAETAYFRALEISPNNGQALQNLGLVLEAECRFGEAELLIRPMLTREPDNAEAWSMLGGVLHAQARHEEAIGAMRRSVEISPHPSRHGRLLGVMQYVEQIHPSDLLLEHERWSEAYATRLLPHIPPISARGARESLRIGFVSPDFGAHAIALLALPFFEARNQSRCFLACYSDRLVDDPYTGRFQRASDCWRRTSGLNDEELADLIRKDELDVLVDLAGHYGRRLLVFARKPAPLQLTWLGYVGTTGVRAIDYLVADRYHVEPGEESDYAEGILRLPNDYICFGPPSDVGAVAESPAVLNGRITFGCFNNPKKYTRLIYSVWSEILRRAPSALLRLQYSGLELRENQERILSEFAQRGIPRARIQFQGHRSHLDFMAGYADVDISLDTFPYSGGVTTCESLWMGVPVVTCPGKTFASRHAKSHLLNAGFPSFVATNFPAYIDLAIDWSSRADDLAVLRGQMRESVRASPLCDSGAFASSFLSAIEECVSRGCRK